MSSSVALSRRRTVPAERAPRPWWPAPLVLDQLRGHPSCARSGDPRPGGAALPEPPWWQLLRPSEVQPWLRTGAKLT